MQKAQSHAGASPLEFNRNSVILNNPSQKLDESLEESSHRSAKRKSTMIKDVIKSKK